MVDGKISFMRNQEDIRKRKVLFVVDERMMGGVSIQLETILNKMDENQFDVDVLVLHDHGTRLMDGIASHIHILFGSTFFSEIDCPLHEVIKSRNPLRILRKLRIIIAMKTGTIKYDIKRERKKILSETYDIEIAYKDGFTALFSAFGDTSRKLHWLHYEYGDANPNKRYPKLFQTVFDEFHGIIAVSQGVLDSFLQEYSVHCPTKVISDFIDEKRVVALSKQDTSTHIPKDEISIVSIGRLHEVKGYERLLHTISSLKNEDLFQNCRLYLIGDGPQSLLLQQYVHEHHLEEAVCFLGELENPYAYLAQMSLFILPSYFESFGLVCLEALALHIPVLATKTAGSTELKLHASGIMVCENSEKGICQSLRSLINNHTLINQLKHEINFDYFDESKIMNEIMEVLLK